MSLQCVATGPNETQRKQSVNGPPRATALGLVGARRVPFTPRTRTESRRGPYNTLAPYSARGMRSPADYRAEQQAPRGEQNIGEHSRARFTSAGPQFGPVSA